MAAGEGDDDHAFDRKNSPSRRRSSYRFSDGEGNGRDASCADARESRENGDRHRDRYIRDNNRGRDKLRDDSSQDRRRRDDRDREKDFRHVDRNSRHREDSERGEKGDYDRRHDYDRERRHRHHRSRSRSHEHRSPSRDRKSKRTSGFDMAAPGSTVTTPATISGLLLSTTSGVGNSLQALGTIPGMGSAMPGVFPSMFPFAGGTQATRHARRVYVGGLPVMANEQNVAAFFSQVMAAIGGNTAGPGDAVVNVYINQEKRFAFVEMRTVEEASNAMALDGIVYEGVAVRVRRPTDYNPSMAAILGPSQPSAHLNLAAVGLIPGVAGAVDGPDRIFVGGLPHYLTDEQTIDLLSSFGPLRAFELVKDRDTGNSKGYAFCVYQDAAVIDTACAALNGLKMGDRTLTVRRASASGQPKPDQADVLLQAQQQIAIQKIAFESTVSSMGMGNLGFLGSGMPAFIMNNQLSGVSSIPQTEVPTRVVCLSKVVSPDELRDDTAYEEILEDMRDECGKYGNLANLVIPRPSPTQEVPGVGMVLVEYTDAQGSTKAKTSLHGRTFGGNTVIASYYSEAKFLQGDYGG